MLLHFKIGSFAPRALMDTVSPKYASLKIEVWSPSFRHAYGLSPWPQSARGDEAMGRHVVEM